MHRAKIVCTLGPAVNTADHLVQLINVGMNVVRLNVSRGDYDEHESRLNAVRRAARITGRTVGVLTDLRGPRIRLDRFVGDQKHYLERGDRFTITIENILDAKGRCSTTFKGPSGDVKPGDQVLIDDGKVGLRALEVSPTEVPCEVVVADPISSNKGINLPEVAMPVPTTSEKDERDPRQAFSKDIDMIALSFVHSGDDIKRAHEIMGEEGRRIPVIVKLERPQAVASLWEIVNASDAFTVARGDLGVGLPLRDMPLVQKQIVRAAREQAKPVIIVARILEPVVSSPQSTRAGASDVANTTSDGVSNMILSGETSINDYPVKTVQTMAWTAEATERDGHAEIRAIDQDPRTTEGVLTHAAVEVIRRAGTRYLVAFTKSDDTTRRLFRLRPSTPLLVSTPEVTIRQVTALTWGVEAHITPDLMVQERMVETADAFLRERGMIEVGERIVTLPGSPMGVPGKTNNLRVRKIKAKGEIDA